MEEAIHTDGVEYFHLGGPPQDCEYFVERDENSITVEAVEEALFPVQEFVDQKILRFGCNKRELHQIRLAVEEIFINICSYAYENMVGCAKISCKISGEASTVSICFVDTGTPFNPLAMNTENADIHFLEKEGGFGIFLVRKIMDRVDYDYKDGRNVLVIEKKLSGGPLVAGA